MSPLLIPQDQSVQSCSPCVQHFSPMHAVGHITRQYGNTQQATVLTSSLQDHARKRDTHPQVLVQLQAAAPQLLQGHLQMPQLHPGYRCG